MDVHATHIEVSDKLNDKQLRLVDEYMRDLNKTRAFRDAGYTCSNPDKLGVRINRLFRTPSILREIERRRDELKVASRHTPLEVMQSNLDYWFGKALGYNPNDPSNEPLIAAARAQALAVAVQAAPYLHPRLQALAVRIEDKSGGGDAKTTEYTLLETKEISPADALAEYTKMIRG